MTLKYPQLRVTVREEDIKSPHGFTIGSKRSVIKFEEKKSATDDWRLPKPWFSNPRLEAICKLIEDEGKK